ncbi:Uncharacterised protein [Mycobacteroides abscessus subsp. bolletii]|nr:Uncharacterised protein [Mycobacteroides abscessus subsp. bolletii]SKH10763.1 Uncharacterised protein [Mycobacteroides abscessus subsp. bolletii]SKH99912.1 Uncharacterised protein [Mycobacteroides abscessus subsp. bolletii]SKK41636.1 Uncharacterised protein [Mycobacteroides abscessus subsp. bolletii]
MERQITAERLEIGCPAEVDVCFADFDDPAELPCDGEVLGNHLAGQRVVDHVDPTSLGDLQDVVDESDRPRIEGRGRAQVQRRAPPLLTTGRRVDDRAHIGGNLYRGHAHTSGGAVDENALTGLQISELVEGVARGEERNTGTHGERVEFVALQVFVGYRFPGCAAVEVECQVAAQQASLGHGDTFPYPNLGDL